MVVARRKSRDASPLSLIAAVEKGVSVASLERLARAVAPHDGNFRFRLVPKATLARRTRAGARLFPEESARVARLEKVWAAACDVWGGAEAARDFLFRSHPLLKGRLPIDVVLGTEFGGPAVEQILGRLKYGTAV
jgi:putative toxin-antitoxin system antitoxin component (TIGR02293 family)